MILPRGLRVVSVVTSMLAMFVMNMNAQCVSSTANGFQENLLQATFHSALYKTSDGYAASGGSTAPDGGSQPNIQVLSFANGYTGIPASTTIVWGTIGGNAQIILLGDDGVIYAGGDEGIVLEASLTSGNAYDATSLGLPSGVGITDISKFQATNEVLMIFTDSGQIYVTGNNCANVTWPCVNTTWNLVSMPVGVTAELIDLSAKSLFIYGSNGSFYTRGKRIFEANGNASIDQTTSWTMMSQPNLSSGTIPVQIELANHEHHNQIGYLILDADGTIHSLGDAPVVANFSNASFSWTKVGLNCPSGELNNVVFLSASDNDNRHVGAGALLADSTIMLWGVDDFNMLAGADSEYPTDVCPTEVCSEPGTDMSHIIYLENGTHLTPVITESGMLCNVGHNSEGGFGDGTMTNRSCYECYSVPSLPDLCIDGSCAAEVTVTASICDGDSYLEQSSVYTETGAYIDIYQTSDGCDSIVTTQLTVTPIVDTSNEVTICQGQSYFEQSSEYSIAGTYIDTYTSNSDCDSVVTTVLSVLSQLEATNEVAICEGQSYFEQSSEYTESGTYTDSYSTDAGCDSVVTTILTVSSHFSVVNQVSICLGQSYFEGGSEYTSSGTYLDNYTTSVGCDSTITTVLEVLSELNTTNVVSICEGESYLEGVSVYTANGTYQDVYSSIGGCDSIVTTVLQILQVPTSTNMVSICQGQEYQVGSSVYSETGLYSDILEGVSGCDSIVVTNLTLLPSLVVDLGMDSIVSCDPIEITFENQVENEGDVIFQWDFGDGSTSSEVSPSHLFEEIGTYHVVLSLTRGSCESQSGSYVVVQIMEGPTAAFSASPWSTTLNAPEIQFFDESSAEVVSQSWQFGDGSQSTGSIVAHEYTEVGEYYVTLSVSGEAGCTDEVSHSISILSDEVVILIPNAFTPSAAITGDGTIDVSSGDNHIFFPYSKEAESVEFFIFNRWGEQLYIGNEIDKGWDGSFLGRPCPQAVYSYRVIFTYPGGEEIEKLGTVTLFR